MPPAEPPPLEHDTWGAPHPKAAVAGPPARNAGFDPKRTVGLIESLSASGRESGSPDTAITFQALLVERQMARALSIFVMHR